MVWFLSVCSLIFLFIRHKPSRFSLHFNLPPHHIAKDVLVPSGLSITHLQNHPVPFLGPRRDCTLMLSPVHSENWDGRFLLLSLDYLFLPLSLLSAIPDNCSCFFSVSAFPLSLFLFLFSISCIK